MIIRCAWCKRKTGDKPPYGGKHDKEVTDSICDDCLTKQFPNIAEKVKALSVTEKDRYQNGS